MLSPLARHLFNLDDEALLEHQYDDNLRIEPEWYCPILPMVLVNGASGIGTGWSTAIPNYDVREIVANVKRLLDGDDPETMLPCYKNFKGSIAQLIENKYVVNGEISVVDDTTLEITELPVKKWTQDYKEDILETMLNGTEKTPALLTDYKEYNTDSTVKFTVKMTAENLAKSEDSGLHKVFKLQNTITSNSMVLFDHNGCIKRYNSVEEILREFFDLRMDLYKKRKDYLEGMLAAESLKYDNIARFILEKIEGTLTIENKKKKDLIELLVRRGYDSDPVKAWKEVQNKGKAIDNDLNDAKEDAEDESGPDYNYILGMPLWNLTKEKKDELLNKKEAKAKELSLLRRKSPQDLWKDDLEHFLEELDKVEAKEREDENAGFAIKPKQAKGKRARPVKMEVLPSPHGRRVEPKFDSIKKKADAIKKGKDRKDASKNGKILDFMKMEEDEVSNSEPLSLADRMKMKGSPVDIMRKAGAAEKKTKAPREPKEPKEPKVKRETKQKRSPKGSPKKGSPKKGGKKTHPWSDSESEAISSDISDDDNDGSFLGTYIPREAPRRAAAARVNFNDFVSDEDEVRDDEDGEFEEINHIEDGPQVIDKSDSDDEDFGAPKPKAKNDENKPAKRKAVIDSDSDFGPVSDHETSKEDKDDEWLRITGQQNTTSQSTASSDKSNEPAAFDISDDDDEGPKEELFKPTKTLKKPAGEKKTAAKKPAGEKKPRAPAKKKAEKKEPKEKKAPAAKKPAKKRAIIDDSDISDLSEDEIKPKKAKVSKKKKISISDDEFDVDMDDSDDDTPAPAPAASRGAGGRSRAPVSYNFGESDSDFD